MGSQGEAASGGPAEERGAGLHISGTAINSISGLLRGSDSSSGNIAGFVLALPHHRLLSLTPLPLPLYSRDQRVLETIVDVTAWHLLCKERTSMWV